MTEHTLVPPRSSCGNNHRLPFNHPKIEELGLRVEHMFRLAQLTNFERDILLRSYAGLQSSDRYLWRSARDQPIWITELRPRYAHVWSAADDIAGQIDAMSGFIWRVEEYLDQIERKYDAHVHEDSMNVPVLVDDDI